MITMSELALEGVPDDDTPIADAVRKAASGRVIHITRGGERIVAIVPESVLRDLLIAAEDAGDAADADASWDEPGDDVPWEQVKAELGL
jgi:hypothetical protein